MRFSQGNIIIGRLDNHLDRSAYDRVKKVFAFHKAHEKEYQNLKSVAYVLLLRGDGWVETDEEKGWIRSLTENHIPFDEILITEFSDVDIEKYEAVILPNVKYLSNAQIRKLDEFAKRGGKVIAVGETGFGDDKYEPRDEVALQCLGISKIGSVTGEMRSSMLLIADQEKEAFPSFKDTDVIAIGDVYVYVKSKTETERYFHLIPPHPFGPPERCYFTEVTEEPGLYRYVFGKGFGVYIPWMPGTFLSREGYSNVINFLADVLLNVCGLKSVAPKLTPMVEVTVASGSNDNLMVQLVNNSGYFGVSYFKPLPITDIDLEVPSNRKPQGIKSIKTGAMCDYSYEDKLIRIHLDRMEEYDALVVTY